MLDAIHQIWQASALAHLGWTHLVMISIGLFFVFIAIKKNYEPLLLVPIGIGMVLGNIPYDASQISLGVNDGPVSEGRLRYYATSDITVEGVKIPAWSLIEDRVLAKDLADSQMAVAVDIEHSLPARGEGYGEVDAGEGRKVLVLPGAEGPNHPVVVPPDQQDIGNASVLWFLSRGVQWGFYPSLIFLGIGAMIDFRPLLANPKLILLGAAAQIGIFGALIGAVLLGFTLPQAASIGVIGAADGPTTIFACSRLAPELLGAVALSAYSYMALVPIIQPPIIRLMTSPEERRIRMTTKHDVPQSVLIAFPVVSLIITALVATAALPLLGMLFFGNLLRECGVAQRLVATSSNALIDTVTILLGISVGAKTLGSTFLTTQTLAVFFLGLTAFALSTAGGIWFAKIMNKLSSTPINPMIGASGISALPMSSRVVHTEGLKADPTNYLLMHAMAANVAGQIGSAVAGGVLLAYFL